MNRPLSKKWTNCYAHKQPVAELFILSGIADKKHQEYENYKVCYPFGVHLAIMPFFSTTLSSPGIQKSLEG
jgi:hypothetical protein